MYDYNSIFAFAFAETVYHHSRIQAELVQSSLFMLVFYVSFLPCIESNWSSDLLQHCISWIFAAPRHTRRTLGTRSLSPRFRSLDWRLASSPPMTLKTSVSNKSLLRSEPEVPPICFTVASPSAICRETWNQKTLWSMMHNGFSTLSFKCTGRRSWVCTRMLSLIFKVCWIMDGRNPAETRSKTPAHDTAQRCRLQPRQPNARYSPPPSWRSSSYPNPRPRWGTASSGPFERPLPQDTKKWRRKEAKHVSKVPWIYKL